MTDIRHEISTKASTQAVFEALTTPDGLAAWWATDADIGTGVGAEHELRFQKGDQMVAMRFRVDAADPGSVVRWVCLENGNPVWPGTTLEWRLSESGGGCSVKFEHRGFGDAAGPPYEMTVGGWKHFMASLESYLGTGTGQPS